jgi:putrescine transport system permease protein
MPTTQNAEGSRWKFAIIAIPYLWLIAFLLVPFGLILKISLSDQARARPPYLPQFDWSTGLTAFLRNLDFENFVVLASDLFYGRSYLQSVQTAAIGTVLVLLVAYPLAYGLTRAPSRWRGFLFTLVILPFWTSFLVRIYAWMIILKPNGFLDMGGQLLGLSPGTLALLNSNWAVLIGIVYSYLPFMVLPLYTTLDKIDGTFCEAARDLGASAARCFVTITIPLSLPGVMAGALLVFIPMVGEFVIPELLGGVGSAMIGKTLWTEFFNNQDWPLSAAIAIGMLVILFVPIVLLQRVQVAAAMNETGAGGGAQRHFSWINKTSVGLGLSFIYLPILLVIAFSFNDSRLVTIWGGFSLKWYGTLFQNTQLLDSAWLSFKLACLSATIATILGVLAALALVRFRIFYGKTLFNFLLMVPIIMPGMIIGLALLLFFVAIGLPRGFYTLLLSHATFGMCFVAVIVQARLINFDRSLEEAAFDLGSSNLQTFRYVTLPLIFPSILSGWALAFVLSLDDLIISSLTTGPNATTLPMRIFSQVRLGVTPEINAASTLMILAVVICLGLAMLAQSRKPST